jgi:hypothetical protein
VTLLHCIRYKTSLQGGGKGGSFAIYFKGIVCDPPQVTSNGMKLSVVAQQFAFFQELAYFRG